VDACATNAAAIFLQSTADLDFDQLSNSSLMNAFFSTETNSCGPFRVELLWLLSLDAVEKRLLDRSCWVPRECAMLKAINDLHIARSFATSDGMY
jgi:hypothetical protein